MLVEVIDKFPDFEELQSDWDAAYSADPDATFFLSWKFMSIWLSRENPSGDGSSGRWLILVARDEQAPHRRVAFLPLRIGHRARPGAASIEMSMGGRKYADYTGLVARSEHRERAVTALLEHVKSIPWQTWLLEYLRLPAGEIDRWLAHMPPAEFEIRRLSTTNRGAEAQKDICPFIPLPADWDTYLAERLGKSTRRRLTRELRLLEGENALRISHAGPETIERDIKILLHLWQDRWRDHKGSRLQSTINVIGVMLMRFFRVGNLFLPVLWEDRKPVGALGFIVDREKQAMHCLITARDPAFERASPGTLLHAHAIQQAIGRSFRTYDFMRGNEPYKYMFGVEERRLGNIAIVRRRA